MTQDVTRTIPNRIRITLITVCGLVAIAAAGFVAGVSKASLDDHGTILVGHSLMLLLPGIFVIAVAFLGGIWLLRQRNAEPVAPRIRKNMMIYWVAGAIGGVLGLVLSLGVVDVADFDLFGNGPIATTPAIFAMVVWLVAMPVLCWMWLRNIDEHEARANADGAVAGAYSYFLIAPVWWVGWRAELFIEPQTMITFLLALTIYCAVWMWRRYN